VVFKASSGNIDELTWSYTAKKPGPAEVFGELHILYTMKNSLLLVESRFSN
jgi:hypothetical protein